jgi:hypothetical protein
MVALVLRCVYLLLIPVSHNSMPLNQQKQHNLNNILPMWLGAKV